MDWIYRAEEFELSDSHILDCFSCGLWTWRLNSFFPLPSFCPPLSIISSLSWFHFLLVLPPPPPHPSPALVNHSPFPHSPFPFSFFSSILSSTQGQRHEESTGFPAEEEWISRKQPSRQARQVHEVSQVSGHFLTACALWAGVTRLFSGSCHHDWWPTWCCWETDVWAAAEMGVCWECVSY